MLVSPQANTFNLTVPASCIHQSSWCRLQVSHILYFKVARCDSARLKLTGLTKLWAVQRPQEAWRLSSLHRFRSENCKCSNLRWSHQAPTQNRGPPPVSFRRPRTATAIGPRSVTKTGSGPTEACKAALCPEVSSVRCKMAPKLCCRTARQACHNFEEGCIIAVLI